MLELWAELFKKELDLYDNDKKLFRWGCFSVVALSLLTMGNTNFTSTVSKDVIDLMKRVKDLEMQIDVLSNHEGD